MGTNAYVNPISFSGIKSNVPRILDALHEHHGTATFFCTPEVLESCEDLVRLVRREHALGLHSHAYYQPEFKGWQNDGDSLKNYTVDEKARMIRRDIECYRDYFGCPKFFRIGRLEPDSAVLRAVSDAGCVCDSSYHKSKYTFFEKLRTMRVYKFTEVPVSFYLWGLGLQQLDSGDSVVLIHPSTPPEKSIPEVYDEEKLMQVITQSPRRFQLRSLPP